MRYLFALLTIGLVAGCFPPDLGDGRVACGTTGACPPDYICRADQHCWKTAGSGTTDDMSMPPGADLAMTVETCTAAGMRVCTDASHSAVCTAVAASPMLDRTCPPTSSCSGGHCQPPTGAVTCKKPSDCSNADVCTPFVIAGAVDTRCAPPLPGATGGAGTGCTTVGFDAKCRSGYCARANGNNVCETPCSNQNDCGGTNCDAATVVVEGANTTALKSCGN
ncbi:MAG: hypothetical protein JWN44_5797 [Myxococcales bacterium]|nr:hypothetical protein [Myxococcales bacterium]